MSKHKYLIYGNFCGTDYVIKQIKKPTQHVFESLKEVFEALVDLHYRNFHISDLSIRYYGYDDRIKKDVYIIGTSRMGKEDYIDKYGCPQFVSYLICL